MRACGWSLAGLLALAGTACATSAPAVPAAPPPPVAAAPAAKPVPSPAVENLDGRDILPFIDAFNAGKEKVRLVLLLSPG